MSYNYRTYGLNTLEVKELEEVETFLTPCLIALRILQAQNRKERRINRRRVRKLKRLAAILSLVYVSKTSFWVATEKAPHRVRRTIDSFSATECWRRFRFRKRDLRRLLRCFQLEDVNVKLGCAGSFTGEEIMLYSLNRLASLCTHSDLQSDYNMDRSNLSAMYNWFIDYIYINYQYLLNDNLAYWAPSFPHFAECIRVKFEERTGLVIAANFFKIFAFHDDTVIGCSRPGGGPSKRGVNAPRYNNFIQMAFYNGWKHSHGTKWQTLELPNGLCGDMHGPFSFRHNDLEIFEDSRLNARIAEVQVGNVNQYCSYGDSIFPNYSHCKSRHRGDQLNAVNRLQNAGMGSMRIANEWHYGFTATLFPRSKHKSGMKLLQDKNTSIMYLVCTLLRNARTCLYGSQTCKYFDCMPPTLENYFGIEPYID